MVCYRSDCKRKATRENPQHNLPREWEARKACNIALRGDVVNLANILAAEEQKCARGEPSEFKCCRCHYREEDIDVVGKAGRKQPKAGAVPMSRSEELQHRAQKARDESVGVLLTEVQRAPGTAVKRLRSGLVVRRSLSTTELTAHLAGAQKAARSSARIRDAHTAANRDADGAIEQLRHDLRAATAKVERTRSAAATAAARAKASEQAAAKLRVSLMSAKAQHVNAVRADALLAQERAVQHLRKELAAREKAAADAEKRAAAAEALAQDARDMQALAEALLTREKEQLLQELAAAKKEFSQHLSKFPQVCG